jgi:hypothetical protein
LYSFFWNKPIKISEIEIKQPQLGLLKNSADSSHVAKIDSVKITGKDSLSKKQIPPGGKKTAVDSSRQTILLTGDSMSEGLMFPFMKYAKYNDYNLQTVIWYSSSTLWWAEKDSLRKLIDKYKPTFIIFTLGSNELFIRNIRQEREKYVQDIIQQAGNIPFVWIGPPNWKKDTGINDMLLANLGEDRFFISKDLTFERANDGRHPSRRASVIWADTISRWITQKCRYPIKLEKPKLPQETILGNWLGKTGEKPLFIFTKDSVQIADSSRLFRYYFNGIVLQIQNGKRPYRANVLKLSRDSLVLQDWEKKMKLQKSFH